MYTVGILSSFKARKVGLGRFRKFKFIKLYIFKERWEGSLFIKSRH